MRQSVVTRRKLVTLAAGTLAALTGPAVNAAAVPTRDVASVDLGTATVFESSGSRVLELLQMVRRAHGAERRLQALQELATALRVHRAAESVHASVSSASRALPSGRLTGLYRSDKTETLLASVIVRELQGLPQKNATWMTRFADLEAVIHAGVVA